MAGRDLYVGLHRHCGELLSTASVYCSELLCPDHLCQTRSADISSSQSTEQTVIVNNNDISDTSSLVQFTTDAFNKGVKGGGVEWMGSTEPSTPDKTSKLCIKLTI